MFKYVKIYLRTKKFLFFTSFLFFRKLSMSITFKHQNSLNKKKPYFLLLSFILSLFITYSHSSLAQTPNNPRASFSWLAFKRIINEYSYELRQRHTFQEQYQYLKELLDQETKKKPQSIEEDARLKYFNRATIRFSKTIQELQNFEQESGIKSYDELSIKDEVYFKNKFRQVLKTGPNQKLQYYWSFYSQKRAIKTISSFGAAIFLLAGGDKIITSATEIVSRGTSLLQTVRKESKAIYERGSKAVERSQKAFTSVHEKTKKLFNPNSQKEKNFDPKKKVHYQGLATKKTPSLKTYTYYKNFPQNDLRFSFLEKPQQIKERFQDYTITFPLLFPVSFHKNTPGQQNILNPRYALGLFSDCYGKEYNSTEKKRACLTKILFNGLEIQTFSLQETASKNKNHLKVRLALGPYDELSIISYYQFPYLLVPSREISSYEKNWYNTFREFQESKRPFQLEIFYKRKFSSSETFPFYFKYKNLQELESQRIVTVKGILDHLIKIIDKHRLYIFSLPKKSCSGQSPAVIQNNIRYFNYSHKIDLSEIQKNQKDLSANKIHPILENPQDSYSDIQGHLFDFEQEIKQSITDFVTKTLHKAFLIERSILECPTT